jgi:hypothetical protein
VTTKKQLQRVHLKDFKQPKLKGKPSMSFFKLKAKKNNTISQYNQVPKEKTISNSSSMS